MVKRVSNWYHVIFNLCSDKGKDKYEIAKVDSPVHYLLANEIIFPLILSEPSIFLWRFHRIFVAKNEHNGKYTNIHQFKFKFYIQPHSGGGDKKEPSGQVIIDKMLKENEGLIGELKKGKVLKVVEAANVFSSSRIGSDCDINWHYAMKEAWPYYIHGASRVWMELVKFFYQKVINEDYIDDPLSLSLGQKLNLYEKVSKAIAALWVDQANHAMFHHINCLFGSLPIWVKWKRERTLLKKSGFLDKEKLVYGYVVF